MTQLLVLLGEHRDLSVLRVELRRDSCTEPTSRASSAPTSSDCTSSTCSITRPPRTASVSVVPELTAPAGGNAARRSDRVRSPPDRGPDGDTGCPKARARPPAVFSCREASSPGRWSFVLDEAHVVDEAGVLGVRGAAQRERLGLVRGDALPEGSGGRCDRARADAHSDGALNLPYRLVVVPITKRT